MYARSLDGLITKLTRYPARVVLLASVVLIVQSGCASFSTYEKKSTAVEDDTKTLDSEPTVVNSDIESEGTQPEQLASADGTTPVIPPIPLDLMVCETRVSNVPDEAVDRRISRPSHTACLNGVPLLIAPAPGACLTSGFGPRLINGKLKDHWGIDLQSKPAGDVVAAASGEVVVKDFREKDFGNWIVIDHGSDVYTSYAHLASVDSAITEGSQVNQGQILGIMGRTGNATNAVHVHYEIRQGELLNKNYFGLKEEDPFTLPGSCPAS